MASIGEYLDSMVVSGTSPDQNISARVSNYTELRVSFRRGSFERYDEEELSHQLGRLGAITWVAYRRARTEAFMKSQGLGSNELASMVPPSPDPKRERYEKELNEIEAEGRSMSGVLRIRTKGMLQWHVDIEPGALRRFTEHDFRTEIDSAFRALLRERELKIITLKAEYFDIGLPTKWRTLLKEISSRPIHG